VCEHQIQCCDEKWLILGSDETCVMCKKSAWHLKLKSKSNFCFTFEGAVNISAHP
jgi:hypothetical protein